MDLNIKKNAFAITVNRLELTKELNNIDKVYQYLEPYGDISIIAVERNELNENIHYHILLYSDKKESQFWFDTKDLDIWVHLIPNDYEIIKYYNYCKKDGNYKLYISLDKESNKMKNIELYDLVASYDNLNELLRDNPDLITRIHTIKTLFNIIHFNSAPY